MRASTEIIGADARTSFIALTVPTDLSPVHLAEVRRLSRSWFYWYTSGLPDYYGYTFILGSLIAMGAALIHPEEYNYLDLWRGALACCVAGFLLKWSMVWHRQSEFWKKLQQLKQGSGFVTFTETGITRRRGEENLVTMTWTAYRRAILGHETLLLILAGRRKSLHILPVSTLSTSAREQLVDLLRRNLQRVTTK